MNNNDLYVELLQLIEEQLITLPDKPEESVHGSLCALWHLAAENPMAVESAVQVELPDLTESQIIELRAYIDKRLAGIPLAHLTQRQQFMGVEFIVGPDALVPRKETELLGYAALEIVDQILSEHKTARVLDVCTGSGNLALAMAKKRPDIAVFGADLSSDAVNLAKKNAAYMGLGSRVEFCVSDLLESYESPEFYNSIDLLTCNPPYISSGKLGSMPGEIIEHELTCKPDDSQVEKCPYCDTPVLLIGLNLHLITKCLKKSFTCSFCEEKCARMDVKSHMCKQGMEKILGPMQARQLIEMDR